MSSTAARPCPACAETASDAIGEENGFELRCCSRCESIFTARLPRPDEAEDYGRYYHEGNLETPAFVHRSLDALINSQAAYRQSNRWLDVGFGAGALLQAAARQGWRTTGTEVAPRPAEAMSAAGFDVHVGSLEDVELPAASFDVISAIEVVEHVPDPGALLAEARRLLRPGGALYLTTPHARGLSARCLGIRWSIVSPPEHLQLFSIQGARTLCRRAGFPEQSVRTHVLNPYELVQLLPWRRRAQKVTGAQRVATSYKLNATLTRRQAGALMKAVANGVLNASRLGDSLKLESVRPL